MKQHNVNQTKKHMNFLITHFIIAVPEAIHILMPSIFDFSPSFPATEKGISSYKIAPIDQYHHQDTHLIKPNEYIPLFST